MDSLETIRKRRSAVDVFKSFNHIGAQLDSELGLKDVYTKKHSWKWIILGPNGPKVRTAIGEKSFAYQGALMLNELDKFLRDERSLLKFEEKINEIY